MNGFRRRRGPDAEGERQGFPAAPIDVQRIGEAAQFPLGEHEVLIHLLGDRVYVERLLKQLDRLVPLVAALQHLAKRGHAATEQTPEPLARLQHPRLIVLARHEGTAVEAAYEPRLAGDALDATVCVCRFLLPARLLEGPGIDPAQIFVQAQLSVLELHCVVHAEQAPEPVQRRVERALGGIPVRVGPQRFRQNPGVDIASAECDEGLEKIKWLVLRLA